MLQSPSWLLEEIKHPPAYAQRLVGEARASNFKAVAEYCIRAHVSGTLFSTLYLTPTTCCIPVSPASPASEYDAGL